MNKKIMKVLLALVLIVPFSMLSACSSTPDEMELMHEVMDVMNEVDSMKIKMNCIVKAKLVMGESVVTYNVQMDVEGEETKEPLTSYAKTKIEANVFGNVQTSTVEMYQFEQNKKRVTYSDDGTGWRTSNEKIPYKDIKDICFMRESVLENMDVKINGTEKIKGKDAYRLDIVIDDDILKNEMKNALNAQNYDIDIKDFKFKYSLYVDKKTKEILKISINIKDFFSQILEEIVKSEVFTEAMPASSQFSFDDIKLELEFLDFNDIDKIEIPKEINTLVEANTEEEDQGNMEEPYKFTIDGKEIIVGESKLSALLDMGYVMENDVDEHLSKGENAELTLTKNDNLYFVGARNDTSSTINLSDGMIYLVGWYTNSVANLSSQIKIGSSKEDVRQIYGQPIAIKDDEGDENEGWYYEYANGANYVVVNFMFESDEVSHILVFLAS